MKKLYFCVLILLGLFLLTSAGQLQAQAPGDSGDGIHVYVKGRPWETDESKLAAPVDFLPSNKTAEKSWPRSELDSSYRLHRPHESFIPPDGSRFTERSWWLRFEVIYFHLLYR